MSCRHLNNESKCGNECKIMHKRCAFLTPNEKRCSGEMGAIIHYLKSIGTYDEKVKDNPEYI